MSDRIKERTIRVRFHSEENDSYVELWKLVSRAGYIARHTHGPKRWYYVSDPHGYRELDHPIGDDVTVIVCGRDGRELFRTSNADGSVGFNTPKQEAYAQWKKYAEERKPDVSVEDHSAQFYVHWATGTPVGRFNDWLDCAIPDSWCSRYTVHPRRTMSRSILSVTSICLPSFFEIILHSSK